MSTLTSSPAWQALIAHKSVLEHVTMRELFAKDAQRFTKMSREACGLFVDYSKHRTTDETLALLFALSRGRDAYEGFLGWLDSSGAVVLSAIILAGVLYHTITWLRLTAHIQVVRLGRRVLPRRLVLAGLLTLWVAVSAIVAYLHIWL